MCVWGGSCLAAGASACSTCTSGTYSGSTGPCRHVESFLRSADRVVGAWGEGLTDESQCGNFEEKDGGIMCEYQKHMGYRDAARSIEKSDLWF